MADCTTSQWLLAASFVDQSDYKWWTILLVVGHVVLQLGLALRVIMRRRSVGESLAWIMIIFIVPVLGAIIYLLIGELRLGTLRARRIEQLFGPVRGWIRELPRHYKIPWSQIENEHEPLARLGERSLGMPALPGNDLELIGNWGDVFTRLIADIDAAETTCHLEFYIWHPGGRADDVAEALIRASGRGVRCRVLLDALGSRTFLRGSLVTRLREAGVQVEEALAGGVFRMLFVRFDLRMHRKIVVIDGRIAYTGSLNLVDPRYFKKDAGVGQWVDAMVRVTGPAVEALAITFIADWYVETTCELDGLREEGGVRTQPHTGEGIIQVLPSGPAYSPYAIEQFLITAIYAARHQIVLTTPYFVPNESLRLALATAVGRGVHVILVVPAKVDSLLVRFASQAFKSDLLSVGVRIAQFQGGLLHTKSVTIDDSFSLFGSLNLDPRSLRLNFEISLAIFDRNMTADIRRLQQTYIDQSELMDLEEWRRRTATQRLAENFARLMEPLL